MLWKKLFKRKCVNLRLEEIDNFQKEIIEPIENFDNEIKDISYLKLRENFSIKNEMKIFHLNNQNFVKSGNAINLVQKLKWKKKLKEKYNNKLKEIKKILVELKKVEDDIQDLNSKI